MPSINTHVPGRLHVAVSRAKYTTHFAGRKLCTEEWFELASLVTLHVLGQCPDHATADWLLEGGHPRVLALFDRLLHGEPL